MNNLQIIYPKCNKHTIMSLENDVITFNCHCGYNFKLNIKDCKRNTITSGSELTSNSDIFKNITAQLTKGNEHLLTYFKEIKDENLNHLLRQMNE